MSANSFISPVYPSRPEMGLTIRSEDRSDSMGWRWTLGLGAVIGRIVMSKSETNGLFFPLVEFPGAFDEVLFCFGQESELAINLQSNPFSLDFLCNFDLPSPPPGNIFLQI